MQPDGGNSVKWGHLKKTAEDAMRPLPKGTRVAAIVEEASYKKASTGSDMIEAKMAVCEGDYLNRKVFNNFVLTPDNAFAMNMFFSRMAAFGIDGTVFEKLESQPGGVEQHLVIIAGLMVGRKVWVIMDEPRTYGGVARDNPNAFEVYAGQPAIVFHGGLPVGNAGGTAGNPPVPQASSVPASVGATPGISTGPSVGNGPPVPPSF